ncbi:MAG: glutathione S-transferase family protein [Oligoflexus sp.]
MNSLNHALLLYTNPQSRGAIAVWMLEELGVPYDIKVLPYGEAMQSVEYRRLNPMAKVPCLVHGDQIVTETAAICAYLADAFPQAGLAPDKRGAYYRWLFFTAGPFEAAVTNHSLGIEIPVEKQGFVGYGSYDRTIQTMAEALRESSYIAGDTFTAADVYVGSHINWGLQFGSIPDKQEFKDYWQRLAGRDAYRRSTEKNASLQSS